MSESMLIPCPHCAALNRGPAERLDDVLFHKIPYISDYI